MRGAPHDHFFKAVFSRVEDAIAHLDAFLPPGARACLDLARAEPAPASFVRDALRSRHADLVYRIPFARDPGEAFSIFEHQSHLERLMPFRGCGYSTDIWTAWLAERPRARHLPPVLPMVTHHGPRPWRAPLRLSALVAPGAPALARYSPDLELLLLDLAAEPDDALLRGAWGGLPLLLLKHGRRPDLLARLAAWGPLLRASWAADGPRRLELIATYVLECNKRVTAEALGDVLARQISKEASTVGMTAADKLRQQGRIEGARSVLLRLLEIRFGSLPPELAARIERAHARAIERWAERVLSAERPEDVLAD